MEVRFTHGVVQAWTIMESNMALYSSDEERFKTAVKEKYPNTPDEDIAYVYNLAQKILANNKKTT
jgi:hypothetical protein